VLPDVYIAMGQTAENVALYTGSAARSRTTGCAQPEPRRGGHRERLLRARDRAGDTPRRLHGDQGRRPRAGTIYEKISQLKPVFRPNGTVTTGNASPLNDAAAAVVITSDTKAKELGLTPLARIVATGVSGLSPKIMGLGPIEATRRRLANAGMSINDIDLYEINEAFAVQVLSARALGMDPPDLR
jgi:acetyl-CoA C-acetyltransferase